MQNLKVGLIGAGLIGKVHAHNLVAMQGIELKTISDLFIEKVKIWAEPLGVLNTTDNYMDIISDPEINAIILCSPPETHAEIIIAAAKAGKHIFCEKPVSLDLKETLQVLEVVKETDIKFQVGFMRRFDHNFKRARQLVDEGKIGDPHIIKITSRDPRPPQTYTEVSGVIFLETTIHDFDMARFLAGSDVVEVYAIGGALIDPRFAEYGDADTAITTLKFQNGAFGVIDNSRKADYGYDQRIEVFGSKGSVTVDNDFNNTTILSTSDGIIKDKPLYFFMDRYVGAYNEELFQFFGCIRNNLDVAVTGYDGFQAELIAQAARISFAENRPIRLSELQ